MRFLEFLRDELGSLNWGLAIVRRFRMGGNFLGNTTSQVLTDESTNSLTDESLNNLESSGA